MTATLRCPSCGTPTENDLCPECDDQAAYWDSLTDEHKDAAVRVEIAAWNAQSSSQTGSPSFRGEGRPALVRQRQTGGPQSSSEGRPPSESVDSTSPLGIGEGQVAGGAAIPPAIDLEDPFSLEDETWPDIESEIRDGHAV